jgi:hypothetical protein
MPYVPIPAHGIRGYSPGRVVHYVFQDEWLDCSLLCCYEDSTTTIDSVADSKEQVTCLTCLYLHAERIRER